MDPMTWTFEGLVQRAMNELPPDTTRQNGQRSPPATVSQGSRVRSYDEISEQVASVRRQTFGDHSGTQLSTAFDYLEYADNPRRSSRRRTQRVLLNVPPHEPVPVPSMADRRISLRSLANGLGASANRNTGSYRADSVVSSSSRRGPGNNSASRSNRSQHSRKRLNASRSDSSSSPPVESMDSDLSVEVCIYTQGTAVPHNESPESTKTCFICSSAIDGDMEAVNAHIDNCLARSTDAAGATPGHEPMVEYEWSGQRRVRATAMIEGGLVAAGIGHASSSTSLHNDDDIDVDAEDETNFGAAQYSDSNLLFASSSTSHKGSRRDDRQAHQLANPQFEEFAPSLDDEPEPSATVAGYQQATGGTQLVIDALKARIREQDRLLQSVQKCLICLEPYDKPCTSINCWHVYCETCWLHTLGTKKLCPQCQQITQPTDLRRVYL